MQNENGIQVVTSTSRIPKRNKQRHHEIEIKRKCYCMAVQFGDFDVITQIVSE